jgi:hypothetical protein
VTVAQSDRGVELEERQTVGFGECRQDAIEAMTVSVGFDHRQYLCICNMRARFGEICAHRREIDLGYEWAGHDVRRRPGRRGFGYEVRNVV